MIEYVTLLKYAANDNGYERKTIHIDEREEYLKNGWGEGMPVAPAVDPLGTMTKAELIAHAQSKGFAIDKTLNKTDYTAKIKELEA
ncbi:unnamed protein product [marine sediment metagenome]|uniref:Uncharacterized protein n=1 Tax=marine sediment metagenome TaxID=412755 RepID=X0SXD3_9ZZZZ